jgi:hypothetical protein
LSLIEELEDFLAAMSAVHTDDLVSTLCRLSSLSSNSLSPHGLAA